MKLARVASVAMLSQCRARIINYSMSMHAWIRDQLKYAYAQRLLPRIKRPSWSAIGHVDQCKKLLQFAEPSSMSIWEAVGSVTDRHSNDNCVPHIIRDEDVGQSSVEPSVPIHWSQLCRPNTATVAPVQPISGQENNNHSRLHVQIYVS